MQKWLVRAEVDLEIEAETATGAEAATRRVVHPRSSRGIDIAGVQIVSVDCV